MFKSLRRYVHSTCSLTAVQTSAIWQRTCLLKNNLFFSSCYSATRVLKKCIDIYAHTMDILEMLLSGL